jgi:small nuclear ribonucleoprotein (snRNP)-like protein
MKFIASIVFKQGTKVVGEIKGRPMEPNMTLEEVSETVLTTEQAIERLTGLRAHISVEVDGDRK